jgi:hypothetical protein
VSTMCLASAVVSSPGEVPDFESSPEVLTWMWMFRGDEGGGEREARPAFS